MERLSFKERMFMAYLNTGLSIREYLKDIDFLSDLDFLTPEDRKAMKSVFDLNDEKYIEKIARESVESFIEIMKNEFDFTDNDREKLYQYAIEKLKAHREYSNGV